MKRRGHPYSYTPVPLGWHEALAKVKTAYSAPQALIHGGAMRDSACKRQVSDVDIAVPRHTDFGMYHLSPIQVLSEEGWVHKRCSFKKDSYRKGVAEIEDVDTYKVPGLDVPVQVITYDYPVAWFGMRVINRNDFGMNQIGYDGKKVFWSHNFERDMKEKTFHHVYCKYAYQARNAISRAKGWQFGKYHDFKFDLALADRLIAEDSQAVTFTGINPLDDLLC